MTAPPHRRRFPLDPGEAALLVVDMQNDFVDPAGAFPIADVAPVVERIAALVEAFRERHRPVLYTVHHSDPTTNPIERLLFPGMERGGLRPGTWGARIHAALQPRENEPVIAKRRFDAFRGTDLDARLAGLGVNDLVLCGCQAQICCDTTARSASCRDYRTTLVADACATRRPETLEPALRLFAGAFGQVLPANAVVDDLMGHRPA